MNYYNPHVYGVYYNGGYQEYDGHSYSNISSSFTAVEGTHQPDQSTTAPALTAQQNRTSRPSRTLTTIATDKPSSKPASVRTKKIEKEEEKNGNKQTSVPRRNQEPAYRFSPYAFSHSSLCDPMSSENDVDDSPSSYSTTWKRNPTDFNLLVVPPTSSVDVKDGSNATVAINLRRPSEQTGSTASSSPHTGIAYSYSYPTIPQEFPHSYTSTVSNRMGMTGPLALSKARNPKAHSDGIGSYLLRKMGWAGPGVGIGARPNSDCEPLASQLELKLDKKGLGLDAASEPQARRSAGASTVDIKLSVAQLNDLCLENGWKFPTYDLVHESGPPHSKIFKYMVRLNGMQCDGEEAATKKMAKASAAKACLQTLS